MADGAAADAGGAPADGGSFADAGIPPEGGPPTDAGPFADAGLPADAGTPCPRALAPADRVRKVVVSHPYDAAGRPAPVWEVLELTQSGDLARPGITFSMRRATDGEVVFTPDGEVGIAVQSDGSLGVFRFEAGGAPTVVHDGFRGSFYAARAVMDPSGARVWVLDSNWRENGGGIYEVTIGCDGRLSERGLWTAAKLPAALLLLGGGRALLAARDVLDSPAGHDVHLLGFGSVPSRLGGADAFGDDEAIVSAAAVTADGRWALVADNNAFSGIPNRIAVVAIEAGGLRAAQVLSPIEDPVAIVASPYGNAALVSSGFGDALLALSYDPAADGGAPFSVRGTLAYAGGRPRLPSTAVLVDRGPLRGLVLVSENVGVRRVRFEADGGITDHGLVSLGSGNTAITGAIGVQP